MKEHPMINSLRLVAASLSLASIAICGEALPPQIDLQYKGKGVDETAGKAVCLARGGKPLTVSVTSKSTRIGGATITLSRNFLDRESGSIVRVMYRGPLENGSVVFDKFEPGSYSYNIENAGRTLCSGVGDFGPSDKSIEIGSPVEVSGEVVGVPTLAMDAPLVFMNGSMAQVKLDNKYRVTVYSDSVDSVGVKWSIKNSRADLCGQPFFRCEVMRSVIWKDFIVNPKIDITPISKDLPTAVGVISGKLAISEKLKEKGLGAVLRNTIVTLSRRADSYSVLYKCTADKKGSYVFTGLVAGEYRLSIHHQGDVGVPLETKDQVVVVKDGAENNDVILQIE